MALQTHTGWRCDGCGSDPIVGVRYSCGNCADFDLCPLCFANAEQHHPDDHAFIAHRRVLPAVPAQFPVLNRLLYENVSGAGSALLGGGGVFKSSFLPVPRVDSFGLAMLRQLAKMDNQVLISPASIAAALSLMGLGASTSVAQELFAVLFPDTRQSAPATGFPRLPVFGEFLAGLAVSARAESYSIANAVWLSPELAPHVNAPFRQSVQQEFGAEVYVERLLAARVNKWVADKTEGRIDHLLADDFPELKPGEPPLAVVVSAVYFRGMWRHPFGSAATAAAPFYADCARTRALGQCQLMGRFVRDNGKTTRELTCLDRPDLLGVELPYEQSALVMRLAVPRRPEVLLDTALSAVSEVGAASPWPAAGSQRLCRVLLPRFKAEWGPDSLVEPLKALGLRSCFENGHHFPGMSGTVPLKIAQVIHQCLVEVDETGTVAAAATAVMVAFGGCAAPEQPLVVRFDCPFAFSIVDPQRELLLFSGTVAKPF